MPTMDALNGTSTKCCASFHGVRGGIPNRPKNRIRNPSDSMHRIPTRDRTRGWGSSSLDPGNRTSTTMKEALAYKTPKARAWVSWFPQETGSA